MVVTKYSLPAEQKLLCRRPRRGSSRLCQSASSLRPHVCRGPNLCKFLPFLLTNNRCCSPSLGAERDSIKELLWYSQLLIFPPGGWVLLPAWLFLWVLCSWQALLPPQNKTWCFPARGGLLRAGCRRVSVCRAPRPDASVTDVWDGSACQSRQNGAWCWACNHLKSLNLFHSSLEQFSYAWWPTPPP